MKEKNNLSRDSIGASVRIEIVHPKVTVVEFDGQKIEIPTDWFPIRPEAGQTWRLSFERQSSTQDQFDELNRYIA